MTEQQEILNAVEEERRLSFRPLRFRVEQVERQRDLYKVIVDPEDDKSSVDESLEGHTANWTVPQVGYANILSVIADESLINLRFATSPPPSPGELIWVQVPDFLGQLLSLWQDDRIASRCLRWLKYVQHHNKPINDRLSPDDGFGWLRERQRDAFRLCSYPRAFLWGPPGTGKTTTLGCMLAQYLVQFPYDHILLLSTTNTAVDQALIAVDDALECHAAHREEAESARHECKRIGLHFIASHYDRREHLIPEIDRVLIRRLAVLEATRPDPRDDTEYASWRDDLDSIRGEIRECAQQDLINARLAAMTTTWATFVFKNLKDLGYDLIAFDEASQVGLAHALMLSKVGSRALFVGDPKQLPPIVQSDLPVAERWLGRSMFAYMPVDHLSTCILNEQNRMAEPISQVVSRTFYDDGLKVARDALAKPGWREERRLSNLARIGDQPIYIRKIEQEGIFANPGWYRPDSMKFICQTILDLVRGSMQEKEIQVVTPFRAQRHRIRQRLRELGVGQVAVTTVHRAQGSERHTILFDPVRGSSQFLMSDEGLRIINVAISRAKARLVITLSRGDRQNPILDYIQMLANGI